MLWIPFTLLAVIMQTLRTAGQKRLTEPLDALTVTLVRYLFGLPFVALYLAVLTGGFAVELPEPSATFWIFCSVASVAQIGATALLLLLFQLRNFAVGTAYARTEVFLTALLGSLFFGEWIPTRLGTSASPI